MFNYSLLRFLRNCLHSIQQSTKAGNHWEIWCFTKRGSREHAKFLVKKDDHALRNAVKGWLWPWQWLGYHSFWKCQGATSNTTGSQQRARGSKPTSLMQKYVTTATWFCRPLSYKYTEEGGILSTLFTWQQQFRLPGRNRQLWTERKQSLTELIPRWTHSLLLLLNKILRTWLWFTALNTVITDFRGCSN